MLIRLTTKDLCARYGLTRPGLRRWFTQGDFPQPIIFGRKLLFDLAEVEAWEATHQISRFDHASITAKPRARHRAVQAMRSVAAAKAQVE